MDLKKYGLVAVLVLVVGAGIYFLDFDTWNVVDNRPSAISLSLFAILGILLMFAVLALVSIAFAFFDLSDKAQALALPEGSVRAVIALALVILFSILSVFLFETLSSTGRLRSIENLSLAEQQELRKNIPENQLLGVVMTVKDPPQAYTIYFKEDSNAAADDFAKQLVILIGTLVTSVTSFYFGAKTATAAVAATTQTAATSRSPNMTLRDVTPKEQVVTAATDVNLEVSGDGLNTVKEVKLILGKNQIVTSDVVSNESKVKCTIHLDNTTSKGKWDVVITDGVRQPATLTAAFEVK